MSIDKMPSNTLADKEKRVKENARTDAPAVAHGKKVQKKKANLFKRVIGGMFSDDGEKLDIANDILVPSIKNVVVDTATSIGDAIIGSIETALFGKRTTRWSRSGLRNGYTEYGAPYRGKSGSVYSIIGGSEDRPRAREMSQNARALQDFSDVVFETRGEAMEVLTTLQAMMDKYDGIATVADFYSASGVSSTFQDRKWGWTSLNQAYPTRTRDGFILVMPAPKYLK